MRALILVPISILMAIWVYRIAKDKENSPIVWGIFAFLVWPIPAVILGLRHGKKVLFSIGCIGITYLLSLSTLLILIFSGQLEQFSKDDVPFIIKVVVPSLGTSLLVVIALLIIARRLRGKLIPFMYAYLGITTILDLVGPVRIDYLFTVARHFFPNSAYHVSALVACADLVLQLLCLIVIWSGVLVARKEVHGRTVWVLALYTGAVIVFSRVLGVLSSFVFFEWVKLSSHPATVTIVIWAISWALPHIILLYGVIRYEPQKRGTTLHNLQVKGSKGVNSRQLT